jgi:DNA-binding NarL/FixJ family response regulator
MIKVIIVEDHELFRLGIQTAIESRHPDLCIVGEAETGAELFALLDKVAVDILILDIALPDMSGIDIARRLKKEHPAIKILAVSAENATSVVQEMLEIGIEGFISKRYSGVDVFAEAIRSIMQGVEYYGKDISEIIYRVYVSKKKTAETTFEFTPQEKRIIELCSEGLPGKLIADRLEISLRTVDNHKRNIFRKLDINNTMEMVQYAVKNGIISM